MLSASPAELLAFSCTRTDPLHDAALNGDFTEASRLISEHPSISSIGSQFGNSLLNSALHGGCTPIIKALVDYLSKNKFPLAGLHGHLGATFLHAVSTSAYHKLQRQDRVPLLHFFVKRCEASSMNPRDSRGMIPLHYAAHSGFDDVILALGNYGKLLHCFKSSAGETPLHFAVRMNRGSTAQLLIRLATEDGKRKEVLESVNNFGRTPLRVAFETSPEMFKLVLGNLAPEEQQAFFSSRDEHDQTPLVAALNKEFVELVLVLMEFGAPADYLVGEQQSLYNFINTSRTRQTVKRRRSSPLLEEEGRSPEKLLRNN